MLGITTTNARVGGFRGGISAEAKTIYNRIIADGGVSNLSRLNFFVKGLKAIYGDLANVPVCYDAHWIGYKLGSGTGATAGQAAAKLYSLTVAGDAVQSTAASQPLLLAHNGDNYFYCSGVAGNYCSTTTSKTFTNFTFNTKFNINTTLAAASEILGRDFIVRMNTTKTLDIISLGGVIAVTTTAFTYTVNTDFWIRITRVGTVLKVFSSTDGINYTQKDSDFTVGSGSITITNSNVAGFGASGAAFNPFGRIYYATIDGILDFNPATYNASTSQTQWTSSTGEIWTISTGTAANGYKGVLVDRVIVQSDGVDDYLDNTTFVRNDTMTQYLAFSSQAGSVSGVPQIIDSSSTNYRNSIFQNVSLLMSSWMNGASTMASASNLLNRRYILSANYNAGISNNLNLNNIAGSVSTYSPTPSATGIRLFSKGGTVSSHNATITTYVYCINNDTANNTTMYNFLKTLNNL